MRHLPRSGSPAATRVESDDVDAAVAELTALAVHRTLLSVHHAGVVAHGASSIAFPGPSGVGKSTLVGACLATGFRYVSDEVLAMDRTSGAVTAFPRPLRLARDARRLLGLPDGGPGERFVEPTALGRVNEGPLTLTHVVLLRRRPGPTRLTAREPDAALASLLTHSFNHHRDPAATWWMLVALAREITVWDAGYESSLDLARNLWARCGSQTAVTSR